MVSFKLCVGGAAVDEMTVIISGVGEMKVFPITRDDIRVETTKKWAAI